MITGSHLICEASVPGIDHAAFIQHANAAKAGRPVSQALAGIEITLDAKLKENRSLRRQRMRPLPRRRGSSSGRAMFSRVV